MKKLVPFILIAIIFAQLLAPFSVGREVNGNLKLNTNKAEAGFFFSVMEVVRNPDLTVKSSTTITLPTATNPNDPNSPTAQECSDAYNAYIKTNPIDNSTRILNSPCKDSITGETIKNGLTGTVEVQPEASNNLSCFSVKGGLQVGACIAQALYWLFFKTTSAIFTLSGKMLDFTLKYSLDDSSYRSAFVTEGWGIVRDFCNMFFILVLLYVAIGTILNLHSVKTKEMIINVVIIGLLINFSLFATQVIIDASNILARVFYNPQTIVITQKDASGAIIASSSSGLGELGEIRLSEAIISKVDPQKIVMASQSIGEIKTVNIADGGTGEVETTGSGMSVGTFILIIFLCTAVNIVGIIAFLSCALIFVSRVVMLWVAMILAPLAFFSYTVPQLQGIKMIGWQHWWKDTLSMAFLAPVFVFFMYIIVAFMDKFGTIFAGSKLTGLNSVVAVIVPFLFIVVLLLQSKKIATDMSGEFGQALTKGIAAAGGIALGGAAVGTALLGRKVIGQGIAKASRTDSAKHFADQKIAHNKKLEEWEANGRKDPKPEFKAPKHGDMVKGADGKEFKYNAVSGRLGGSLNEKQRKIGDIDHARHEEDEAKKAAGLVDAKGEVLDNARISGEGEKLMQDKYNQTKRPDAESAARKGVDSKGKVVELTQTDNDGKVVYETDANGVEITDANGKKKPVTYKGEAAFKSENRKEISERIMADSKSITNGDVEEETKKIKTKTKKFNPNTNLLEEVEEENEVKTGKKVLTKQGEKKLEDELNIKLNATVKLAADTKLSSDFTHMRENAQKQVNVLTRTFAGANKASYDVRNLTEGKTDKRESMFSKVPVALVAAVAMGVRGGLKSAGTSNGGVKVEGNFMKDLSSVVSDSLKGTTVNVDLSGVGAHKSSADSHGGGGGHH